MNLIIKPFLTTNTSYFYLFSNTNPTFPIKSYVMKRHPPKLQNLPKVRFILEIFWHKKWLILYILLFPLLILFYATTGLDGLGLLLVNVLDHTQ